MNNSIVMVEINSNSFLKKYQREIILLLGNLVALLILGNELKAQDRSSYIYGKVTTYSNEYVGQIRWSDEEAIWLDLFNAMKVEKTVEVNDSKGFSWDVGSIWKENMSSGTIHQFSCQFGDIKEIKSIGKSRLTLVHKDGTEIVLNGKGYNDVGATLYISDDELGKVKVPWDRIKSIEFSEAPKGEIAGGEHLFGTVSTFKNGDFEGYVIWDLDERLGEEKLDGDIGRDDLSIPFKNIASIRSRGDGSEVVLKSGRELFLTGSNDVDDGNRGVVVMNENIGYVEIPWSNFDKVEFSEPRRGVPYKNFKTPKGIYGQVYTRKNKSFAGRIVYDLDEFWEYELIEGKDGDVEYSIPIRNLRRIAPKNDTYSEVVLKDGTNLLLGKLRDVSRSNGGILIISKNEKDSDYVRWSDVLEIVFE